MNTPQPTLARSARHARLLTRATRLALIAGPLGYLLIETAGIRHP